MTMKTILENSWENDVVFPTLDDYNQQYSIDIIYIV